MSASSPILVTGGTGFIGRHLVEHLLTQGAQIRVLARSAKKADRLFGSRVEIFEGNLIRAADVEAACRGIGQVYHLGGCYRFGARFREDLWQDNVVGTTQVLAACRRNGVERLIHCSTAGVLRSRQSVRTAEDFPAAPPAGCPYKQSKWQAERLALDAAADGFPVVIASPTAPLGSGDEQPTPTGRMVLDLLQGRFPACTRTGLNVVAVEDVATGLIATANHGRPGRRYILGAINLSLADLLREIARQGGITAPREIVPWILVLAAGALADGWTLLGGRGGDRVCWETAWFAGQQQFFDLAPTQLDLGWQPEASLEEIVAAAVSWFSESSLQRIPEEPAGHAR